MLTCTYTSFQLLSSLVLSSFPLLLVLLHSTSIKRIFPLLTSISLISKSIFDFFSIFTCQDALFSSSLRLFFVFTKAVEVSEMSILIYLLAKGIGVFRHSLLFSEYFIPILLFPLVFFAWFTYFLNPDPLYITLTIDIAVVFCITTKSLLESQEIIRILLHRHPQNASIRSQYRYFSGFQRYFIGYYAVLTLQWVCIPGPYFPMVPDLKVYIWLGVGLYAVEIGMLGLIFGHVLGMESVEVECTDAEACIPYYLPSASIPSPNSPILVVFPGHLKPQKYLGEELIPNRLQ